MSVSGPSPATHPAPTAEVDKDAYKAAILKKALDNQKAEAAEVLKVLQPKGRVLDIRA
ncbi:MAG: hypothetical protein KIT11_06165 [Fimbriimonadaceae bacterium]|nr:hypothetical protein [Fimbriimonadaceae bacterium]QYK55942.1 MAG: hypothetical protein KF733_00355 [Fimbriimonadaceae bacterium]